jgi:hypothetical protein
VLSSRISAGMNEQLLQDFTKEEVCYALNQMAPLKAPGPDGFSADFFQEHWASIGEEVCAAVLGFLKLGIWIVILIYIYSFDSED